MRLAFTACCDEVTSKACCAAPAELYKMLARTASHGVAEVGECHCRVLANVLFPNWLVTGLLLGLLIFLTYKTAKKALSLHRCEVRYLAQREEQKCQSSKNRIGQGLGSKAGAGEATMKALAPQPSPGRAPALPGNLAAQADIDRDTREALALSAAGRLGSSEPLRSPGQSGSSGGETGSGSSGNGSWNEAAEEPSSAQASRYAFSPIVFTLSRVLQLALLTWTWHAEGAASGAVCCCAVHALPQHRT